MADYKGPATHPVGGGSQSQTGDSASGEVSRLPSSGHAGSLLRRLAAPVIALVASAFLVACLGDAPEVDGNDPVLVQGRQLYINNCIGCHGANGGGGTGPKINEGVAEANYPDIADQIRVVAEGKNQMPAFAGKLSDDELEAVTRYTREGL